MRKMVLSSQKGGFWLGYVCKMAAVHLQRRILAMRVLLLKLVLLSVPESFWKSALNQTWFCLGKSYPRLH